MASFPDDPDDYRYHRIIFYDSGRSPKRKTIYLKKSIHYGREGYTKTEAQEWKKRRELAFADGEWDPWGQHQAISQQSVVTLTGVIEEYKEYARRIYADSTYEIRAQYLDLFADHVGRHRQLTGLTGEMCNDWINQADLSFPTKKNRMKTLSVFFKWAGRKYDVDIGPMEVIARQAEKQKYYNKQHKAFITQAQLGKIINSISGSARSIHDRELLKDFYRLAFYTTRRRSDLLNIKPSWILDSEPLLKLGDSDYLPKSQIVEYVPLLDQAWQLLMGYKKSADDDSPIFGSLTGDFVTKQFQEAIKSACPELAGKVSLHNLRDSGIMYLIYEKDLDLKHVMQMTGHRDLRSLQIYTHSWARKTLEQLQK